jgi:hypothetical protein
MRSTVGSKACTMASMANMTHDGGSVFSAKGLYIHIIIIIYAEINLQKYEYLVI